MKKLFYTLLIALAVSLQLNAQAGIDSVEVIDTYKNLYKYQNFYLAGQPSIEALTWMKEQEVNKIINLRSENENKEFTNYAYNEEIMAKEMGFEYHSIPVKGKEGYKPEKLAKMDSLILANDIVLIHCAAAGRVRHFFIAYLIKSKGYSIDEAIEVGKGFGYYLQLELLLGEKLSFSASKE